MKFLAAFCFLAQALTLLDGAFAGRTRQASFLPSDVAGLVSWYRASAISSSAGTEITSWSDSATTGWTLYGVAGSSPYVTNSSEINGQKWLNFDGASQTMRHTNGALAQPCTVFTVLKFHALPPVSGSVLDGTNAAGRMLVGITSAGAFQISGGTSLSSASSLVPTGKWMIYEASFKASPNAAIITNGVSVQTGDAGSQAAAGLFVGQRQAGGRLFNGGLAEILIYTNDVSAGDRTSIRDYFYSKYGAASTW